MQAQSSSDDDGGATPVIIGKKRTAHAGAEEGVRISSGAVSHLAVCCHSSTGLGRKLFLLFVPGLGACIMRGGCSSDRGPITRKPQCGVMLKRDLMWLNHLWIPESA